MNFSDSSVPKSYVDFWSRNIHITHFLLEDDENKGLEYCIGRNNENQDERFIEILNGIEFSGKNLSEDTGGISMEILKKAFVFGTVKTTIETSNNNIGKLFFHPISQCIYVIYQNLYVKKLAENFDSFLRYKTIVHELKDNNHGEFLIPDNFGFPSWL